MTYRNRSLRRRGAILFIVLALLALFAITAMAYVMVTAHYRRAAESMHRIGRQSYDPGEDIRAAMMQVLRGDTTGRSVLGPHSLLEDMYGNATLDCEVTAVNSPLADGQILELVIREITDASKTPRTLATMSATDFLRRNGCVVTAIEGDATGQSSRIVGVRPTAGVIQVLAFQSGANLAVGDRLLINGAPFVGTGAGFDPNPDPAVYPLSDPNTPWLVGCDEDGVTMALRPNPIAPDDPGTPAPSPVHTTLWNNWADMLNGTDGKPNTDDDALLNEDYDAVDFQNMLLAMQRADGSTPIPSMHRPELVRYMLGKEIGTGSWTTALTYLNNATIDDDARRSFYRFLRKIMLRPIGFEVTSKTTGTSPPLRLGDYLFTGSNPDFDPLDPNTWDVDCDGDGTPDAIWVDVGLPVRTLADGRKYRPLVAILCTDLDGRVNLNAHGCASQLYSEFTDETFADPQDPAFTDTLDPDYPASMRLKSAIRSWQLFPDTTVGSYTGHQQLARGQGYGPADINPGYLLGSSSQYRDLLLGDSADLDGRYGDRDQRGASYWAPGAGVSNDSSTAYGPFEQALFNRERALWNYATDNPYRYSRTPSSGLVPFGAPIDLSGSLSIGTDIVGQPVFRILDRDGSSGLPAWLQALYDSPYELDLSRSKARGLDSVTDGDNPFSVAELERLLRPYDKDHDSLPSRLEELAPNLAGNQRLVTTESWDVPCPNIPFSVEMRSMSSGDRPQHIVDFLLDSAGMTATEIANDNLTTGACIPPELRAGLRMDLNRPFGNYQDDDGDRVIDDPEEVLSGAERVSYQRPSGTSPFSVDSDLDNNGTAGATVDPRLLYARQLYTLLMATVDEDWYPLEPDGSTPSDTTYAQARALAQFAVNAVDFRDSDAIMTGFEFDPDPFDGWGVDGDLTTNDYDPSKPAAKYIVWGCERPELLISETMAFHDRRTEDLTTDPTGKSTTSTTSPDDDFDQRYRPEGSLFIELYNPWGKDEAIPGEFYYDDVGDSWPGGVVLNAIAPSNSPVWRFAITEDKDSSDLPLDPDDPTIASPPSLDRVVYLADISALDSSGDQSLMDEGLDPDFTGAATFYSSYTNQIVVPHKGYAVVGPGNRSMSVSAGDPIDYAGSTTTYLGAPSTMSAVNWLNTRRIELDPAGNEVRLYLDATGSSIITDAVPAVVDMPQRLSVSEPTEASAYDEMGLVNPSSTDPVANPTEGRWLTYTAPEDLPSDDGTGLMFDGTQIQHRVIYLQRLADPTKAFDPDTNPYLTIDTAFVDLTCFNGATPTSAPKYSTHGVDGSDDSYFNTRERGEVWRKGSPTGTAQDLWSQELPLTDSDPPMDDSSMATSPSADDPSLTSLVFQMEWQQTLGWLNEPYSENGVWTAGDLPSGGSYDHYVGGPKEPFAWLMWNNRPFISDLELLYVPGARSSQLLRTYTMADMSIAPYDNAELKTFGHLMNLFCSDETASGPDAPRLYRLLELVGVPSRFVGTTTQINPGAALSDDHKFNPPFNFISKYREPGKINLNTIFDEDVYKALMGTNSPSLSWTDFEASRQGAASPGAFPTRFGNPFRGIAGRNLVPLAGMFGGASAEETDPTLLRAAASGSDPLFADSPPNDTYQDGDASPFFRYRELQRLRNLVTTRSNVYAVWITLGYFEVHEGPVDAAHPDGYRLGAELGSDYGDITRHRAFYMIDRTIPVAFERGKDHNAEEAILLERVIE